MQKIKVLIIDDETDFAVTLAERLELRDFSCKAAEGLEKALELLQRGWMPTVILLDLKMPELDGLAALSRLKQELPEAAVIMLTGHGSTADGIEGMKRGLFDYLLKPVEIGELADRIREAARK